MRPKPSTHDPRPVRFARAVGLVSAAALLLGAGSARAQVDVFPPLDNVMLLVDTSGSMEFEFSGDEVACYPELASGTSERSRWIHLLEALTGSIQDYSCQEVDRTSDIFAAASPAREYGYNNVAAPDYKYPIPFHRALSSGCAVRPGTIDDPDVFQYPASPVSYKHYDSNATCAFSQDSDGVIDAFANGVRFGLMTFDTLTDPSTGVSGGTGADYAGGVAGTWSYYANWLGTGTSVKGSAVNCDFTNQEVGARNGAAPPWEGRMVNFGDPSRGALAHLTKAQQIQEILLASRPFGATPIAGMLKDAEDFFFTDASDDRDPEDTSSGTIKYGPKDDPYVRDGCRDQFIILLTDGYPNLDLRPDCEGDSRCDPSDTDCRCPYDEAEEIAQRLADTVGRASVPVYVVGMALESFEYNGDTVTCAEVDLTTACKSAEYDANRELQACCSLQFIAKAGADPTDTSPNAGNAYFVDSPEDLKKTLNLVLTGTIEGSSRTQPTFSGAGASAGGSQRFFSSYVPVEFSPWKGMIERQRYECVDEPNDGKLPQPTPIPVDLEKGDDFGNNLNSGEGPARRFYTVLGGRDSDDPIDSRATIRRFVPSGVDPGDGIGDYGGRVVTGTTEAAELFSDEIDPDALEMPKSPCPLATGEACRDRYVKWLIGLDNGTDETRCETPGTKCNLLGDVFHSNPRVVNRPLSVLRDETYSKFASLYATRPAVLYTSTNDGFLHAFKTMSNDEADADDDTALVLNKANNELWAFIPPAILPELHSIYPYNHQLLLDGSPVVKDVVAVLNEDSPDDIVYARTQATAQTGNGSWRTVMVQSFGAERPGYFAVDITKPVPDKDAPGIVADGGPRFLWQLTRDAAGNSLFGKGGATPLITTVFIEDGDGMAEVAVAVLPGGPGGVGDGGATGLGCNVTTDVTAAPIDVAYPARPKIKCYDDYPGAHSLTIVRLDTGVVLRTFRRTLAEMDEPMRLARSGKLVGIAKLDSPITGQPVAYPADVGAVADRIFIGDADGRVWKVDVSGDTPEDWTMSLFFDAFPQKINGVGAHDWDDGQPIQTPTLLSVDELGQLTVSLSTGDQDTAGTATSLTNYVWSLTETVAASGAAFETDVNWYQPLADGERVTGPMSLFSSTLYFSTFAPPESTDSVCNSGSSRLWGVDYVTRQDEINPGAGGKAVVLRDDANALVQFLEFANLVPNPSGDIKPVVFGVTIAQLPTCFNDQDQVDDDWLGYGSHTAMNEINPGKFELVVHTGQAEGNVSGVSTNAFKMDLPMPPALSSIDSWAAIVE
jgi:type IV pilus assembly protein PilY1